MALLGLAIRLKSAIRSRRQVADIPQCKIASNEQVLEAEGLQIGLLVPPSILDRKEELRGWAFSEIGETIRGQVQVDNYIYPLPINEPRLDIARQYGLNSKQCNIGFRVPIDSYIDKQSSSGHNISILLEHNGETIRLGPYLVKQKATSTNPKLFACLERPIALEKSAKTILVKGWVVGSDPSEIFGELLVNGQYKMPINLNDSRPDVVECFPETANFGTNIGFSIEIPWDSLSLALPQADIMVKFSSGDNQIALGPVPMVKEDSPVLRHHRGSYKGVWNLSSTNINDAMLSVAGTSDLHQYDDSGEITGQTLLESLQISSDDNVLEIGCGTGRIARTLAPKCKHWTGVDISSQMLAYARSNLASNLNVSLVELKDCSLEPIGNDQIDKLYCSAVFMHLDEWDRFQFVREAFRVLRPAGICYFDNINLLGETGWEIFNQTSAIDPAQRPASISKLSTPQELKAYLQRAGFIDVKLLPGPHMVAAIGTKPA